MSILSDMIIGFTSVRPREKTEIVKSVCKSWYIIHEDMYTDDTDFLKVGRYLGEIIEKIV